MSIGTDMLYTHVLQILEDFCTMSFVKLQDTSISRQAIHIDTVKPNGRSTHWPSIHYQNYQITPKESNSV